MKVKKFMPLLLCLLYTIGLIPFNQSIKTVKASQSSGVFTYYNADTTSAYNKYAIKGTVSENNIIQFDDAAVIVSSSGIYKISNDVSKEYLFTDANYIYKFAGRYENKVYLLAKANDSDYYQNKLLIFNMDNGYFNWEDYSQYIGDKQLVDLIIDNNGNRYFCLVENYTYVFKKIDSNKSLAATINTYISSLSDAKIFMLKSDNKNNIWFAAYFEGNDTRYHTDSSSTLYSIESNSIVTKLNSYGGIKDYLILDNGHIWYIPEQYGEGLRVSNYINHYDRYGRLIKGYSVTGVDSVDVDDKGDIWVLDSKGVKKLENDKFVDKYPTSEYMNKLSINKFGSILVYGENEIMQINNGKAASFKIDSFVRNSAYVTKDNLGNIKIISRDDYKYHNLMITSINKDGSLKSNSVSILDNIAGNVEQRAQDGKNIEGTVIDSEDVNNKFFSTYKTAKVYNDEIYVFAGDNELYQIKGLGAGLHGSLSGKVYAIDIKDKDNKPQLYAVSKEIKTDGNEIINIFLTSLGENDEEQTSNITIPITGSSIQSDNKKYYNLEKFLQDKNGFFYIDVKETDTKRDYLFRKVEEEQNPTEDIIAHDYFSAYAGAFLDEHGNIEYVIKNGINNEYSVYKASYSWGSYIMTLDKRFENQNSEFEAMYEKIQNVVQAYDGSLFVLVDNKIYFKNYDESQFKLLNQVKNANSITVDKYGRVYIGTDGYGAACYMHPNSAGVDVYDPGVSYMNISKYSRQVPVDSSIEIVFNENLYNGVNYEKITLKDKFGKVVLSSHWINGNILIIKPEKLLYRSSLYTVTIPYNSVTDSQNRAFANDYTFNFTTAGETIPPSIVKASVDKKNNSVNITLSEEIEKGSSFGKIVFTDVNGKSAAFTSNINGKVLTVKYVDPLVADTTYKLFIPAGCVNDLEGNQLAKGYDLYFVYK